MAHAAGAFPALAAWLTRYRRLVRDYEARLDVSEAMIYAGMSSSLIRRIAHP
jgi:hypothetical protein